jgi:hypothetical protein
MLTRGVFRSECSAKGGADQEEGHERGVGKAERVSIDEKERI